MRILLLAPALALAAALVACDNGDGEDGVDETSPSPAVTATETDDGSPTAAPTSGATEVVDESVCQPNPDPATPEFQVIDQPSQGDTITSPVTISGQVLAFEATFQVAIFDVDGNPIVEMFGMANATEIGELAPFSIDVEFDVDEDMPACIWVYEASAMDGSPIHVGQIPVLLSP